MSLIQNAQNTTRAEAPRRLRAREIAERALRRIGAFPINDAAPDAADLEETLLWMDMVMQYAAATRRRNWLFRTPIVSIPLTAGEASFNLADKLGPDYPPLGILFPKVAYIRQGGQDSEISIWRRQEYEDIANKTATGVPKGVFIDQVGDAERTLFLNPVPTDGSLTLRLVVQTFAPSVVGLRGTRDQASGEVVPMMPAALELWLATATAAQIGAGPVRRLPDGEVRELEARAAGLLAEFDVSGARERPSQPRITERVD